MSEAARSDWFDIGDVVIARAKYEDEATDALVDPTNLVVQVKAPDGTVTTPTAVRDSLGRYHVTLEPTQAGVWVVKWVSTGTGKATEPWHFLMRETLV